MKDSFYAQITFTLLLSELTYAFSLLRELAHKGQLVDNEAALRLPMNSAQLQRILDANPNLRNVLERNNEDSLLQYTAVAEMKERSRMRQSIMHTQQVIGEGVLEVEARVDKEEGNTGTAPTRRQQHLGDSTKSQGSRLVVFSDQSDKGWVVIVHVELATR